MITKSFKKLKSTQSEDQNRSVAHQVTQLKPNFSVAQVIQMRWIHHEGSNESHWEGRTPPTARELEQLRSQGRVQVANELQSIPQHAPNANRPHGLFLAPRDAQGEIGAPFPLAPPTSGQSLPQQERNTSVAWPHDGRRVQHAEPRRSERAIHGGVSAREQLQEYGMPDYPGAAHAHIQPDHATPVGQDREDIAMRHPSTEEANQQHTTREYAQSRVAREQGMIIASRRLQGERPSRPGLFSSMEFGSTFLTGDEMRTHRDSVPYFTHQPGRYGDEERRHRELELFGARALSSEMLDQGFLGEEEVPDHFYVSPDRRRGRSRSRDRSLDRRRIRIRSERSLSPDERRRRGRRRVRSRSRSPGRGRERRFMNEIPHPGHIGPPAVLNLNAGNMVIHYHAALHWAYGHGTFSHEFLFMRNNPNAARDLLHAGGMALGAAQAFVNAFAAQIALHPGANHGYVQADLQEQILQQLGSREQLLAVIRYLRHG